MKKSLLVLACFFPAVAFADCPALDYQELKDMPVAALTKEICTYALKATNYTKEAATERQYAQDLRAINEANFSMQRSKDAGEASDKGAKLSESSEQCKSQIERIQRILGQKGLDEPAIKGLCE